MILSESKFNPDGTPKDPSNDTWKYQAWTLSKTSDKFRGSQHYHLFNEKDHNQALDLSAGE